MLVERKISTKINYDVLKDLDKTTLPLNTNTSTIGDETSVSSVTEVTEDMPSSESDVSRDDGQVAGPSTAAAVGSIQASMTTSSPYLPPRKDRLPSLQSRKRSLPSFARGAVLPSK